jgi:adenine-specific DNA-methyltransferase
LIDEKFFAEFESKVNEQKDILTVYIVTDFEKGFKSMTSELKAEKAYQLYRDYLDNFRINIER